MLNLLKAVGDRKIMSMHFLHSHDRLLTKAHCTMKPIFKNTEKDASCVVSFFKCARHGTNLDGESPLRRKASTNR